MTMNHHKKAMKVYRLAGAYADAEHRTTSYQKRFMRKAEIGTKVYYAGMRWMVLDKALLGEKAMLIRSTPLSKEELPSGKEGENLKGKKLTEFLNGKFTSANFSDREKVMMEKKLRQKNVPVCKRLRPKKKILLRIQYLYCRKIRFQNIKTIFRPTGIRTESTRLYG